MAEAKKMRSEASTSSGGGGGDGDRGNGGRAESVVIDVGRRKSTCGYCKSGGRTSISHGLWAESLTVDHYQALLDGGWRRSGCFLYKPEMERTCCPSYTIRLKASDFMPSKEQVRVSKRMQRFLDGTIDAKKSRKLIDEPGDLGGSCIGACNVKKSTAAMECSAVDREGTNKADQFTNFLSDQIDKIVELCLKNGELSSNIQLPKASVKKVAPAKRKLQAEKSEDLIYTCNIAFLIAATLKRTKERVVQDKSFEHGVGENKDSGEISPKMIAEILSSNSKQLSDCCGFSIRACNGHINFYSAKEQIQLVGKSGKCAISKSSNIESDSTENGPKRKCGGPQGQRRTFEIRLKKSCFDEEEYALYRKYQLQVHNDTLDHVSESSYRRFLVDSPLVHISPSGDGGIPPCGFGSFHQQYVVDGQLIAVGVIDILPNCLSSKYLFWDPDLAFLSLGKYSALEEIKWVSENQINCPSLQYYYLGYYIHSCNKMRYKAAYRPSELLCPLRYQWVPYDVAKPLLDRRKYVVLSNHSILQNGDSMLLNVIDDDMEEQQNKDIEEAPNDVFVDEDEMTELDSEDSDESDSGASGAATMGSEDNDMGNVLLGLRGASLRYRDLRHAFDSSQRKLLESHLQRYARVVGTELSEQMVYSLG